MSQAPDHRTIAEGRHLRLMDTGGWEYAERAGATGVVAILAVTDEESIVLTEQFRPPVQAHVIDLAAGLAGDIEGLEDESLMTAARRELEEETGYTASDFEHLATLPTSPGMVSERIELMQAHSVREIGDGGGDDSEDITVHVVPLASMADWLDDQVRKDRLVDPKVYAALWWQDRLSCSS